MEKMPLSFGQTSSLRFLQRGSLEMERAAELTFGAGRYTCAGKTIAFLELNKIFAEVSCGAPHS